MRFSQKKLRSMITWKDWTNQKFIIEVSRLAEERLGVVPDPKTVLSWISDGEDFHTPGRYQAILNELFGKQVTDFYEPVDSAATTE